MSVKQTVRKQYADIADNAARSKAHQLRSPPEGWLATFRKALGMSQVDVAERLGVGRATVQQAERREPNGSVTLETMGKMADSMGGRLVYAIVPKERPEKGVSKLVDDQAQAKAEAFIRYANAQMALEEQALPTRRNRDKAKELAAELVRNMPRDFWRDG